MLTILFDAELFCAENKSALRGTEKQIIIIIKYKNNNIYNFRYW